MNAKTSARIEKCVFFLALIIIIIGVNFVFFKYFMPKHVGDTPSLKVEEIGNTVVLRYTESEESYSIKGIEKACEKLKAAGAKRALPLSVSGAFHSPLMQPAKEELEEAINATTFNTPVCPVYQNVDAKPHTSPQEIKENLVAQLTAPVRWTPTITNMINDGATEFTECGPGSVQQGLISKIKKAIEA